MQTHTSSNILNLIYSIVKKKMGNKSNSVKTMEWVIHLLSHQPDFPADYCNIASKHLFKVLKDQGKNVRIQHSYREIGDGHTFVVETQDNGKDIILDPTYAQYDQNYPLGFAWESFPDPLLEQNRLESSKFMDLQRERFDSWVYNFSED